MIIDKVVRNIYAIGGGITLSAFGISLTSSKINTPKFNYPKGRVFSGKINSINDIEDLEYTKGCKFFFYDKDLASSDKMEIRGARDFKKTDAVKSQLLEEAQNKMEECTPGRFFYKKI